MVNSLQKRKEIVHFVLEKSILQRWDQQKFAKANSFVIW